MPESLPSGGLLPPEVLDRPIRGVNLTAASLRQQLGMRPTLLSFLRHFG